MAGLLQLAFLPYRITANVINKTRRKTKMRTKLGRSRDRKMPYTNKSEKWEMRKRSRGKVVVHAHSRRTPTGKVVRVKGYTRSR